GRGRVGEQPRRLTRRRAASQGEGAEEDQAPAHGVSPRASRSASATAYAIASMTASGTSRTLPPAAAVSNSRAAIHRRSLRISASTVSRLWCVTAYAQGTRPGRGAARPWRRAALSPSRATDWNRTLLLECSTEESGGSFGVHRAITGAS